LGVRGILRTMSPRVLRGACLCRRVEYAVTDEFVYAVNCHCRDCQRATGSAFKPFAGIAGSALRLTQGAGDTSIYGDPAGNHNVHCRHCGSLLYSVIRPDRVHVTLGTLLDVPTIRPTHHIFAASKAPWHEIGDSLPQYAGHKP
jgi:hypothetical protein